MSDSDRSSSANRAPDERDAEHILSAVTGHEVASLRRFPNGLAHYVYDARLTNGEMYVVRLTRHEWSDAFVGAVYWSGRLRALDIMLPEIIYADPRGEVQVFPTLILKRLPGTDLGEVYPTLTPEQKRQVARRIVDVLRTVATLPPGPGFGYARSYNDPNLAPRWKDVLDAHLERSRSRICSGGIVDEAVIDRVQRAVDRHCDYFTTVEPICFLDDITTKNVIVADGALSGIVDVDVVCFGDALRTLALTQMSILNLDYDHIYTDAWLEMLALTREQREALTIYTAMFCVDFLAELGHRFNQDIAVPVKPERLARLTSLLDTMVPA